MADKSAEERAYEERRQARAERLRARARAKRHEAATIRDAIERKQDVMMGTPVLVGHHSEKRHRRDLDRMHKRTRHAIDLSREADDLERRAKAAETSYAIDSDDPAAVRKLKEKIDKLEANRARFKEINRAIGRLSRPPTDAQFARARKRLEAINVAPNVIDALLAPDFAGRYGIPAYQLSNTGTEIRRLRKRLEELDRRAQEPRIDESIGDVRIVEEDNRLRLYFPGKPAEPIRKDLKSRGFRWSSSAGAWQRKPSGQATYYARQIAQSAIVTPEMAEAVHPKPVFERMDHSFRARLEREITESVRSGYPKSGIVARLRRDAVWREVPADELDAAVQRAIDASPDATRGSWVERVAATGSFGERFEHAMRRMDDMYSVDHRTFPAGVVAKARAGWLDSLTKSDAEERARSAIGSEMVRLLKRKGWDFQNAAIERESKHPTQGSPDLSSSDAGELSKVLVAVVRRPRKRGELSLAEAKELDRFMESKGALYAQAEAMKRAREHLGVASLSAEFRGVAKRAWKRGRAKLQSTKKADPLSVYLGPPGSIPGIGAEEGKPPAGGNGVAKYTSPHGSYRYVAYAATRPVSVLQVVSRDGKTATIANVFTAPEARRKGWASNLLRRARRDFHTVHHADDKHISAEGKAWRKGVKRARFEVGEKVWTKPNQAHGANADQFLAEIVEVGVEAPTDPIAANTSNPLVGGGRKPAPDERWYRVQYLETGPDVFGAPLFREDQLEKRRSTKPKRSAKRKETKAEQRRERDEALVKIMHELGRARVLLRDAIKQARERLGVSRVTRELRQTMKEAHAAGRKASMPTTARSTQARFGDVYAAIMDADGDERGARELLAERGVEATEEQIRKSLDKWDYEHAQGTAYAGQPSRRPELKATAAPQKPHSFIVQTRDGRTVLVRPGNAAQGWWEAIALEGDKPHQLGRAADFETLIDQTVQSVGVVWSTHDPRGKFALSKKARKALALEEASATRRSIDAEAEAAARKAEKRAAEREKKRAPGQQQLWGQLSLLGKGW